MSTYTVKIKAKSKTKQLTDEESREYHRKRLYELSLKSIGEIPQLDDLNEEQSQWIKKKRFYNYK